MLIANVRDTRGNMLRQNARSDSAARLSAAFRAARSRSPNPASRWDKDSVTAPPRSGATLSAAHAVDSHVPQGYASLLGRPTSEFRAGPWRWVRRRRSTPQHMEVVV